MNHKTHVQESDVVVERERINPVPFAQLVAGIPVHRAYFAWAAPDGTYLVGVGHAWRMMASGTHDTPLATLGHMLDAAAGDGLGPGRAFAWRFFDPSQGTSEAWRGFSPLEVAVPEILYWFDGTQMFRVIAADAPRLSHVVATAEGIARRTLEVSSPVSLELEWNDASYAASVAAGLARIEAGDLEKIVLARRIEGKATRPIDIGQTLATLQEHYPTCFVYAIRPGGTQSGPGSVFLGATPERLARIDARVLATEALAGTAPRGVSAAMDERLANELLSSDKDLREHEVVCQRIEAELKTCCAAISRAPGPTIKRLKNVQHLHTPIAAELREGVGALDVVDALHPTPAVGGFPRDVAVATIAELERMDRGLYAGTAGWFDAHGNAEFAVLLRCALIDGPRVSVFSGAGIVAGSDPDTETRETRIKAQAILECLR